MMKEATFQYQNIMKIMYYSKYLLISLLIILMQLIFIPPHIAYAATSPDLGQAASFSVLGFSDVTNTGTTSLSGDLGVWSGSSITGGGTINVGGATHTTDSVAQQAQADAGTADGSLTGQANTGGSLGALDSLVLVPGVYDLAAGSLGGGVLTLDGPGVYIFRTTSTLVSAGSVSLINGARACDVFWHVQTAATINGSSFVGTIIAKTGIQFGTGVSLNGRALAIGSAVTLQGNAISGPSCAAASSSSSSSNSSSNSFPFAPVCVDSAPSNSPNLFQIDRAGSKATVYFTPVNDHLSYYYIAYGLSPGDERYGVSFPASLSSGVVNFTINDLNPDTTYFFKVRGGSGCAPGEWSNNKESNSKNPMLPNTGNGPQKSTIPWQIPVGVFIGISTLLVLIQKKQRCSSSS
ncbi:MAG: ice-binding family protein [Candidatus Roizmanbacteria bacterium]|nr:ice-binding family protein [Candidatus Roizmanbacteria bacterium]